ncbi:hypothetical protein [Bacillus suaedaesalsae]|uniref:Uncharacterized protein n=1 Tax=Bacillus suaedaesalsae TaxID=2810349 RepID=A0ABS2DNL9_9BACI|nr:hypothetical protein [Bacillus suaedaesalsae]MBM6619153.1 hypothetical protein [Bacillus suaedaesalsae]
MLKPTDKHYAEKVLKYLFLGSQIDSIEFGLSSKTTKIYFVNYTKLNHFAGKLYLNIESSWCIDNQSFPTEQLGLLTLQLDIARKQIYENRSQKIVDISLGEVSPHLEFTLENGRTLYVYGYHDQYESWEAGVQDAPDWLVVAIPGNDIAVWSTDAFDFED